MENIFCKHLNLDFDFDLSVINQFKETKDSKSFSLTTIDNNLQDFLKPLGIITTPPTCFYTAPSTNRGLHHIDSLELDNMVKLNYIIGGNNTIMQWFKFHGDEKNIISQYNKLGGGYLKFDPIMCELIWEEELKSPSLVNAGIPHNVKNKSNTGRWSISYTLFDLTHKHLQWKYAEQIFKN